jgi:hypothetical protein
MADKLFDFGSSIEVKGAAKTLFVELSIAQRYEAKE